MNKTSNGMGKIHLCIQKFLDTSPSHHLLRNIARPIAVLMLWSACSVLCSILPCEGRGRLGVTGKDSYWHLTISELILPFILHCPCNKTLTLSTVTLTISSSKAAASAHNPILRTFSVMWCCKIHCNIDSRSFYNRRRDISRRDENYIWYMNNNTCSL